MRTADSGEFDAVDVFSLALGEGLEAEDAGVDASFAEEVLCAEVQVGVVGEEGLDLSV